MFNLFSSDGQKIYQLSTEFVSTTPLVMRQSLLVRDAEIGRTEARFQFARDANVFGIYQQKGELVAESPRQTWHFEVHTLRLINIQTHAKLQITGGLCPDGRTVNRIMEIAGGGIGSEFVDLASGKSLWQSGIGELAGFSLDGRLSLWQRNNAVIARDTRTGKQKWRLRGPQSSVLALAPDQRTIYEARPNGELWKWPR